MPAEEDFAACHIPYACQPTIGGDTMLRLGLERRLAAIRESFPAPRCAEPVSGWASALHVGPSLLSIA